MHRSYNSYNPVASKLLQKRWDEKHFSDHRRAVTGVKPEIDSTPPITFMHLHLKLKKLQLEEERLATIERDNRILLEKMSHTMRNKGQLDNINSAVPKSLSKGRRERELVRITKENMEMLARISNKRPAISREMHEKEWKENLQFMGNISSFPEDWYLRNGNHRNISQSNPNLNTTRASDVDRKTETQSSVNVKSEQKQSHKKSEPVEERQKKASVKKSSPVPAIEKTSDKVETPDNQMNDEVKEDSPVKDEYAEDFD